jgi:hypothetical protein
MIIADDTDEEKEGEKKIASTGPQKKSSTNNHPSSSSSASKTASCKAADLTNDNDEKNKENKNNKHSESNSNSVNGPNSVQTEDMRLKKNRKTPIGAVPNPPVIQKGGANEDGNQKHMVIQEVDAELGIVDGDNETDDRYWMCTHCSFDNDSTTDSRKCCMCEMRRSGDRALKRPGTTIISDEFHMNDGSQSRESGHQKSESVKKGGDSSSSSTSKRKAGEGDSLACLQTQSKNEKSQSQQLKRPSLALHR